MDQNIPERLIDQTTIVKNHTWKGHLISVMARILLGILILNGYFQKNNLIILCLLIIIIFGNKFLFNPKTWKVYMRTVLSYSTIAIVQYYNITNANAISGTIAIADALMGLQSRYITSNFKE